MLKLLETDMQNESRTELEKWNFSLNIIISFFYKYKKTWFFNVQ